MPYMMSFHVGFYFDKFSTSCVEFVEVMAHLRLITYWFKVYLCLTQFMEFIQTLL